MKCPFCGCLDDKVLDSRGAKDGEAIRRRRECSACGGRFTTFEQIEQVRIMVVKRDGRREPFDRAKVLRGITTACEKRPVAMDTLEGIVDRIERSVLDLGGAEVESSKIGELAVEELRKVDQVAYIRFASVYRQFEDIGQFKEIVDGLGRRKTRQEVRKPKSRSDRSGSRTP